MKNERPWLVKIHCVNHRLELVIKDAVSNQVLILFSCVTGFTSQSISS